MHELCRWNHVAMSVDLGRLCRIGSDFNACPQMTYHAVAVFTRYRDIPVARHPPGILSS
jgi:hypothetical protein